jgi:hypothetical protein
MRNESERIYVVSGRDHMGRVHYGRYTETEARELAEADRLNNVVYDLQHNVVHFTH